MPLNHISYQTGDRSGALDGRRRKRGRNAHAAAATTTTHVRTHSYPRCWRRDTAAPSSAGTHWHRPRSTHLTRQPVPPAQVSTAAACTRSVLVCTARCSQSEGTVQDYRTLEVYRVTQCPGQLRHLLLLPSVTSGKPAYSRILYQSAFLTTLHQS
ncbi:hypothetical protein Pmani_035254 [Petrolisthes manimaculis]|uniref:Uncharacterized protein n=1 Tax=Petrolisthes manimaculis TaxID=1843537 RepID=A0AAE1NMQ4_9EUCA|nr:hypothetical protein Pmani_035254 [Petrolisthes manimaculis]